MKCYLCKVDHFEEDLRPYGLDGADVCFHCSMSTPENKKISEYELNKLLDKAIDEGNGVIYIGGNSGPSSTMPQTEDCAQGSEAS